MWELFHTHTKKNSVAAVINPISLESQEVSGLVQMLIENFAVLFGGEPALAKAEPMDTETSSGVVKAGSSGIKQQQQPMQGIKQSKGKQRN